MEATTRKRTDIEANPISRPYPGRIRPLPWKRDEVTAEEGVRLARAVAINALAVLKSHLGELAKVRKCVKITGYIASAPGFTGQAAVLNGASELLVQVFGDSGRHARAAVGVSVLPLDSPLEADFIFEAGE